MDRYGLVGRNISYSFSRGYFAGKFERERIDAAYQNFDLPHLDLIRGILREYPDLKGFNVTIPYKQDIIGFLDELDPEASEIGAVNTVKIESNGILKGYNTDHWGFSEAIKPFLNGQHERALILGTGGASRAVEYACTKLGIEPRFVSRKPDPEAFSYQDLNPQVLQQYKILINCTPLGTSPDTSLMPPVPVENLTKDHLVFDLIYNPPVTRLMELSSSKGAVVTNGMRMLELQAEKAWEIWNGS